MKNIAYSAALILISTAATAVEDQTKGLPTITVTADFREKTLLEAPVSATIIESETITRYQAQHLEQVLSLSPNVNFSSGSSRARYLQIRGIGERSQFIDPVNPSVGLYINDTDFTGAGTAGTLFDVERVEILRGPQGTRFGANSLAGTLYIRSHQPTETFEHYLEASAAEYDTYSLGGAFSGPLSDTVFYRLASQKHSSDGYMENVHLGRDDTNNYDEQTTRAALRWLANDDLTININALYADIDNGYDAFSLDNNRTTLSDNPGHDRQESFALSTKADWLLSQAVNLEAIVSHANTNTEYGYDEDWSFPGLCENTACDPDILGEDISYASTDNYIRDEEKTSVEVRFLSGDEGKLFNGSTDWVAGLYYQDRTSDLERQYTYAADFASEYETHNSAAFAELTTQLNTKYTLTVGLRLEHWEADYSDSQQVSRDFDETLHGGKVVLDYLVNDNTMLYASIARGYKAGGVNSDGSLPAANRFFKTEYQWAYELGTKFSAFDQRLQSRVALFYTDRKNLQVKNSILVTRPDLSTEFIESIDNAGKGNNYGIEVESQWQATDNLQLQVSLGLLETEFEDHASQNLEGREQAHAPAYQYSIGFVYRFLENWSLHTDLQGKDEFYFSDSHDYQSDSYQVLNASVQYNAAQWTLNLWAKNLTDEEYFVRGFGFGNDPRDFYSSKLYTQLGEPKILGATLRWQF